MSYSWTMHHHTTSGKSDQNSRTSFIISISCFTRCKTHGHIDSLRILRVRQSYKLWAIAILTELMCMNLALIFLSLNFWNCPCLVLICCGLLPAYLCLCLNFDIWICDLDCVCLWSTVYGLDLPTVYDCNLCILL